MGLVVAARYSFPHEAEIAKASLEAAGIPAVVADQHHVNANWLLSNALGGVRVLVPEQALDDAREILDTNFSDCVDAEVGEQVDTCAECGGQNIIPHTRGKRPAFLVFLLLGFPLFFFKHGLKCEDCGNFDT